MKNPQIPQIPQAQQVQPLPHDICAPLALPQGASWPVILCAVLVLVLLLSALFYFFVRKKRPKTPPNLQQESMQQLHALRLQQTPENALLWTDNATHILRHYLEQRFALPATRQTTEEFFQSESLKKLPEMNNKELQRQLRDALQCADLIKFAKMQPDTSQLNSIEKAIEYCIISTPFPEFEGEKQSKRERKNKRGEP